MKCLACVEPSVDTDDNSRARAELLLDLRPFYPADATRPSGREGGSIATIGAKRIARMLCLARAANFLTPHRGTATIEKVTRFQATLFTLLGLLVTGTRSVALRVSA
jgi:hypothetical protein